MLCELEETRLFATCEDCQFMLAKGLEELCVWRGEVEAIVEVMILVGVKGVGPEEEDD